MKKSILILFPVAAALLPTTSLAKEKSTKPLNIIYIMTDDHAYQMLSAYNNKNISTPNLDRMAQSGIRFANSFVCNSISGPSRACLLTGKYSKSNGMLDNSITFDGSQQTFPKLLQGAGYKTAIIGKWHLGGTPTGFNDYCILPGQGSYYNPDFITPNGTITKDGYVTDIITDMSIDWLKNRDQSQPFCLLVHHKAVHRVWMSDTTHLTKYEDQKFELPNNFYDNYHGREAAAAQEMSIFKDMDLAYDLKMHGVKSRFAAPYTEYNRMNSAQKAAWDRVYKPINDEFSSLNLSGRALAEWKFQRYMRDYAKCVASLDDNIGRLLDYLEQNDMLENTLVVYASDQGFYMGEHGWFDKRFMYEESMRTPLIMMAPKSFKGRSVVSQLVQNIDYAPTFLELAGIKVPSDMHGTSLVPLLKGEKTKDWRNRLYYHYYEYPAEHAVRRHEGIRNERYKLIHFYGHDIDSWELYDIKSDPTEMVNQFDNPKYKIIKEDLQAELLELADIK